MVSGILAGMVVVALLVALVGTNWLLKVKTDELEQKMKNFH